MRMGAGNVTCIAELGAAGKQEVGGDVCSSPDKQRQRGEEEA